MSSSHSAISNKASSKSIQIRSLGLRKKASDGIEGASLEAVSIRSTIFRIDLYLLSLASLMPNFNKQARELLT